MQITIIVQNAQQDLLVPVPDVPPNKTLGELKAMIEPFIDIAANQQKLFFNNRALTEDALSLEGAGIHDGDMLSVLKAKPRPERVEQPPNEAAETMRLQALGDGRILERLRASAPELADSVNDPTRFGNLFNQLSRANEDRDAEKQRAYTRLNEDPFDVESQRKIEELIREEAVQANLNQALEEMPEVFGRVNMLYIPVEVNGTPVKAFVDSGAQATIMSPACAEQCNVMRLLDKRFAGIAKGVGTAAILGRVHMAPIQIGQHFLDCNFTVLEGKDVDMLLGLDMLKRYQACIDLEKNVLRIGGDEVSFLPESEIPKEGIGAPGPTIDGPSGIKVDGRSGALIPPEEHKGKASDSAAGTTRQHWQNQQTGGEQQPDPQGKSSSSATELSSESQNKLEQLVQMGFPEEQAKQALELAGGNIDVAASYLFGG